MVESCFAVQMHVAKGRMGQHQLPQCVRLHFGRKDSGLGDSVIRFLVSEIKVMKGGGMGLGLEELPLL